MTVRNFATSQSITGNTLGGVAGPFYASRNATNVIGVDEYEFRDNAAPGTLVNLTFGSGATTVFGRPRLLPGVTDTVTSENGPYKFRAGQWVRNDGDQLVYTVTIAANSTGGVISIPNIENIVTGARLGRSVLRVRHNNLVYVVTTITAGSPNSNLIGVLLESDNSIEFPATPAGTQIEILEYNSQYAQLPPRLQTVTTRGTISTTGRTGTNNAGTVNITLAGVAPALTPGLFLPAGTVIEITGTTITTTQDGLIVNGALASTPATYSSSGGTFTANVTNTAIISDYSWDNLFQGNIVDYDYVADEVRGIEEQVTIRLSNYTGQLSMLTGDSSCRPIFYGVNFVFDKVGGPSGNANTIASFNWAGASNVPAPPVVRAAAQFYSCRARRAGGNTGDFRIFGPNLLFKGIQITQPSTSTGASFEMGAPLLVPPVGLSINNPNYRTYGQRPLLPFVDNVDAREDRFAFSGLSVSSMPLFISSPRGLAEKQTTEDLTATPPRRSIYNRGVTLVNPSASIPVPYIESRGTPVASGSSTTVGTHPTLPILLSSKDTQFATAFGAISVKRFGAGTYNAFQRVILNLPDTGFTVRIRRTGARAWEHGGSPTGLSTVTPATYVSDAGSIRLSNGFLRVSDQPNISYSPGNLGDGSRITTNGLDAAENLLVSTDPPGTGFETDRNNNTGTFARVIDDSFNQLAVVDDIMSDGVICWEGLDHVEPTNRLVVYIPTYWQGVFNAVGNDVMTYFFTYDIWIQDDRYMMPGRSPGAAAGVSSSDEIAFFPGALRTDWNGAFFDGNNQDVEVTYTRDLDRFFGANPIDIDATSTDRVDSLQDIYDGLKIFERTRGVNAAYDALHADTLIALTTVNTGNFIDIYNKGIVASTNTSDPIVQNSTNLLTGDITIRWGTLSATSFNPTTDTGLLGIGSSGTIDLNASGLTGSNMSFNTGRFLNTTDNVVEQRYPTLTNVYGSARPDGIREFRLQGNGSVAGPATGPLTATNTTVIDFGTIPAGQTYDVEIDGYDISNAFLRRSGTGTVRIRLANGAPIPRGISGFTGFIIDAATTITNTLTDRPVNYVIARTTSRPADTDEGTGFFNYQTGSINPGASVQFFSTDFGAGDRVRVRFSAEGYIESLSQLADDQLNNRVITQVTQLNTGDFLIPDPSYTIRTTDPGMRTPSFTTTDTVPAVQTTSFTGDASTTVFTLPDEDAEAVPNVTINGTSTTAFTFTAPRTVTFTTAPGSGATIVVSYRSAAFNRQLTVDGRVYDISSTSRLTATGTKLLISMNDMGNQLNDTPTVQALLELKSSIAYTRTLLDNNEINIISAADRQTAQVDTRYVAAVPLTFTSGLHFTGVLEGDDNTPGRQGVTIPNFTLWRTGLVQAGGILRVPIEVFEAGTGVSVTSLALSLLTAQNEIIAAINASEVDVIAAVEDNAL